MAKTDLAAFEKQVDQHCASCVDDLVKELKRCNGAIIKRVGVLAKEINSIRVPKAMTEDELKEIPGRVDEIMKKHNASLEKGLLTVLLKVSVDAEERTVWVDTHGIKGNMSSI